jgi:hypothetical protein
MRVLEPKDVAPWVRDVLLAPSRDKPVIAITTSPHTGTTWIEPKELADALGADAEVVLLETGDATWELAEALPPRLDVYGGAIRIWWPGLREDADPYDHRLYIVRSTAEARDVFQAVVRAVRASRAPREQPIAEVVAATVASIAGTHVELAAGGRRGPLRFSDVPLSELVRCLEVGTPLRARAVRVLADGRSEFSVQELLPSPWDILGEWLRIGDVVIGRVRNTRDFGALIEVLPTVTGLVHISELDWTYVTSVPDFVSPGQLVAVKVLAFNAREHKLSLSVKRAFGTDPRPLPSLVPDGVPFTWATEDAPREEPSSRAADERDQLAALSAELEASTSDRMRLAEANKRLREQAQQLKKELRSATDTIEQLEQRSAREDPLTSERGFLLGVRQAYARLFDEGTRHDHPLRPMRVGSSFLGSLRELDRVDLEKVLEVCAQVAANAAHELASRGVHQLRAGPRGAGSRVRASDQAMAWRCALQVNSPSARRLHWWSVPGPGGPVIEFASVGVHDELSIPE